MTKSVTLVDWYSAMFTPLNRNAVRRATIVFGMLAMICAAIALKDFIVNQRESARRGDCIMHLAQLRIALNMYHDKYGSLPPASMKDANGIPVHSWRVLLLPFYDLDEVYRKYRFDEPWNGPHNSRIQEEYPPTGREIFSCPSSGLPWTHTNYVAVTGADTLWPDVGTAVMTDSKQLEQGPVIIVDVPNMNINWMEPRDISIDDLISIITSDNREHTPIHRGGFLYFDPQHIRTIPRNASASDLRKIFSTTELRQ